MNSIDSRTVLIIDRWRRRRPLDRPYSMPDCLALRAARPSRPFEAPSLQGWPKLTYGSHTPSAHPNTTCTEYACVDSAPKAHVSGRQGCEERHKAFSSTPISSFGLAPSSQDHLQRVLSAFDITMDCSARLTFAPSSYPWLADRVQKPPRAVVTYTSKTRQVGRTASSPRDESVNGDGSGRAEDLQAILSHVGLTKLCALWYFFVPSRNTTRENPMRSQSFCLIIPVTRLTRDADSSPPSLRPYILLPCFQDATAS